MARHKGAQLPSSIRTIPSAQESHLICRVCSAKQPARGLSGRSRITAGGELHPAPKTADILFYDIIILRCPGNVNLLFSREPTGTALQSVPA